MGNGHINDGQRKDLRQPLMN